MLVKESEISKPKKAAAAGKLDTKALEKEIDAEIDRLRGHVQNHHKIELQDKGGEIFKFTIRPVTKLAWDVDRKLMRLLSDKKEDEFLEEAKDLVEVPSPETMRHVLSRGTISPRFSSAFGPRQVDIDDFLSHDELAIKLYAEIVNLSWKDIGKLEEESDGGPPSPIPS